MKIVIHRADSRGKANHGWLNSSHTFSFAHYYNSERMGFGALRVINDDYIAGGTGFDTHPHKDMEIISVPISGALEHKDSMGNIRVIRESEIQVMSAGTGVAHSEYNHLKDEVSNFLQIWVIPERAGVEPNYDQKEFDKKLRENKFQLIVSPDGKEGSLKINQQAYFSLINLTSGNEVRYEKHRSQNGIYFFVMKGELELSDQLLYERDGAAVESDNEVSLKAQTDVKLLVMEVPLR